jgi:co-chaperonin GroES (HSP10)
MELQRLLSDYVLVELEPLREKTIGGIVKPGTVVEPLRMGKVKMVGPGRRFLDKYVPTQLKPGATVAFFVASTDTKGGRAITYLLREDERIIRENDVLFEILGPVEVSL